MKMKFLRTIIAAALCGAASMLPSQSSAMTFREEVRNGLLILHFDGKIEHGDYDKVFDFYRRIGQSYTGTRMVVSLNSTGGFVLEASKIATFLRELNQSTIVAPNNRCYSACFILFAAGQHRFIGRGATLGVHRAGDFTDNGEDMVSKALTLQMSQTLIEYGVSPQIIQKLMATDFSRVAVLNEADLRSMSVTVIDAAPAITITPTVRPAISGQPRMAKPRTREDVGATSPYGFSR